MTTPRTATGRIPMPVAIVPVRMIGPVNSTPEPSRVSKVTAPNARKARSAPVTGKPIKTAPSRVRRTRAVIAACLRRAAALAEAALEAAAVGAGGNHRSPRFIAAHVHHDELTNL